MPLSDADIGLQTEANPFPPGTPLGVRNNNPGNLRPVGASEGFQRFNSMQEGVDAADSLLDKYGKAGRNTISKVVNRWAPSSENNTRAYIKHVSGAMGLGPDEPLNLEDRATRARLRDAMLDHETPGWRDHLAKPLSDADIGLGTDKPVPQTDTSHFLTRAGKDLAGLADMVLSSPGSLIATIAGKGYETFAPLPTNPAEAKAQGAKGAAIRANVAHYTTSPIAAIMHAFGYKDDYQDSDIGKVTKMVNDAIGKGGDYVEKHSGGTVTSQQLQTLATDLMNLAPLGFSRYALMERGKLSPDELKTGKIKNSTAEDILGKYTKETGNPEGMTVEQVQQRMHDSLTQKSDAEIAAEGKAYDLMSRGASLKETQAAIKANPLVGKKLDEFMARRKEVMQGPLSTHIPIDDILDPLPKAPKNALPGMENRPATGSTAGDGVPPTGAAGNPPKPTTPAATPLLPGPVPRLKGPRNPGGTGPLPPRGQGGAVDLKTLLPIAGVAAGAYIGAQAADREKLEGAILGGFGGLAATILPRYAGRIGSKWGSALKLGATTAGVSYGLSQLDKDHPVEGAVLGVMWGMSHMLPKAKIPMVGNMSIDDLINARNGQIATQERQVYNTSWAMRTAVPDEARRAKISEAVEAGSPAGLNAQEIKVYNAYKGFTSSFGAAAQNAGVLKDLVQNYVTHVVDREALPRTKVQEVMDALFGDAKGSGGASPNTGFAKHRKYDNFQQLEAALQGTGLRLRTKDIADLVDIYGSSMARAIENKKLFDNLKAAKVAQVPNAKAYIEKAEHAPQSYQTVNTPQLQGYRVHPDLAPAIKFVAESTNPGYVTRGLLSLSLAQKRLATGLSLFHAQNLINAYVGASGVRSVAMIHDINAAIKAYRQGGLGDTIDTLLQNGLKIEKPMEADVRAGEKLGAVMDSVVNTAFGSKFSAFEKGFGAIEGLQRKTFDKLTWDYLHTGLKLALATREFEKAIRKNPGASKADIAKQVSSFVNDTFGGLDWYRVATETQSQIARNIALNMFSPRGRSALQILMFAPDWTMSTFRAMYKALPGSGAMPLTRTLHQKYVLRTAILWATLMNGYNIAASGHPIWDNKDPTKIEWRDGTTQQIAKHAMEGPEWLLHPRQTALNKLGMIPSEVIDQLAGVEYMSAEGRSIPMQGSRIGHLASNLGPMSFNSGAPGRTPEETAKRAALSALGTPVYRMTPAEKEAAKKERAKDKKRKVYGSKHE